MGTADPHPVPVRMPVRKLPHLLRSLHPGMRTVRMSKKEGVTRTGYRYGQTTDDDDCCGSQPPRTLVDDNGETWIAGDCWCTLPDGHEGQCLCEPCHRRTGAPGWH